MEQVPGGTSPFGNSHTATGTGKASGEEGLPALGLGDPVTATTVPNRRLVYRVHFPSRGLGHVRSYWLRRVESSRRNPEPGWSGGLLQFCDTTLRSTQWRRRIVRQGTDDLRQHPSGAGSTGGTPERDRLPFRRPHCARTSGADQLRRR